MKLNLTPETDVISFSGENAVESTFTIDMNAKAFSFLTDTLYKNKIGSIVREISSNAYDSHVQAGKADIPFEIHMPNIFEPYFSVKDFGIGLSQEDIQAVYTTFFKSTKDQSNDVLGAFGVGGKSPFGLVRAFNVTSVTNHLKCHYSIYINEKGIPSILLLQKEITDQCNGVEVTIPVKKDQFLTFQEEVTEQLRFFKVKPTIVNGSVKFDTSLDNPELLFSNNSCKIVESFNTKITAVLGVVGYPIEIHNLGSQNIDAVEEFTKTLSEKECILFFNIGEIEVTASREGISYTEKTIDAVIKKITDVKNEFIKVLLDKITTVSTPWEKAQLANSYGNSIVSLLIKNGLTIPEASHTSDKGSFSFDVWKANVAKPDNSRNFKLHRYADSCESRDVRWVTPNSRQCFLSYVKPVFFVRDTKKRPIVRLKKYYNDNVNSSLKLLVFQNETATFSDADIAEFSRVLGGVEINRISALPEPSRPVSTGVTRSSGYKHAKIYEAGKWALNKFDNSKAMILNSEKVFEDINDIDPGIYICLDQPYPDIDLPGYGKRNPIAILAKIYETEFPDLPSVYLLKPKQFEKLEDTTDWIPVDVFVTEFIQKIKGFEKKFSKIMICKKIMDRIEGKFGESILEQMLDPDNYEILKKGTAGTYLIRLYKVCKRVTAQDMHYDKIMSEFGRSLIMMDAQLPSILNQIEQYVQKIPFVTNLDTYYGLDIPLSHVIDYMNQMS